MWKVDLVRLSSAPNEYFFISGKNQDLHLIKKLSAEGFMKFDQDLSDGFDHFIAGKIDLIESRILLKRDAFGSIPCFFLLDASGICYVDSSIESLLKYKENLQIDKAFVALFLANDFSDNYREYSTFYKDIYQVPAGCVASISASSVSFIKTPYHNSDEGEGRDILAQVSQSIKEKIIDEADKLAIHISGGLDSSSLAAISIKDHGLENSFFCTISDQFSKVNERIYRDAFAQYHQIAIHEFSDGRQLKEVAEAYIHKNAQPPLSFNSIALQHHLLLHLRSEGIHTLMTGYGGDGVIDHGYDYLREMLSNGDMIGLREVVKTLTEENLMIEKYKNWERFSFEMKYGLTALHLLFQFDLAKPKELNHMNLYIELGGNIQAYVYYFSQLLKQKLFGTNYKRATIDHAIRDRKAFDTTQKNRKLRHVQTATLSEINESLFGLQKLYGVKMIAPFLDVKVLNESLKYTHKEKFGNGIGRAHFREVLNGYLPDFVRLRYGKSIFDHLFVQTIAQYIEDMQGINEEHLLWEFVNKKEYDKIVFNFARYAMDTRQKSKAAFYIHRVLNLKLWLDYFQKLRV